MTTYWYHVTSVFFISLPFCSPQLHKLGVLPFEEKLSGHALRAYQEMWGNNGDFISRQYTGTAAMKVAPMLSSLCDIIVMGDIDSSW